jgi:glycosyltransferase involved in cell wall biosynthesis
MIVKPGAPWHVAHIIGHLRTGGAERQLVNYLLAADRHDFRHTVVCLVPPGELAGIVRGAGIEVIHIPVRTRYAYASARRFAKWFADNDVAVVHAHMHHAALFSRLGARMAGVPVLMATEHGKELWKGPLRLAVDHWLSGMTARHICVSREIMALRQRRERINSGKLVLVPNGVPIPSGAHAAELRRRIRSELGIAESTSVVGTVGRFVQAKGYEHLLRALAELRRARPDVKWLAVGEGELRPQMATLAEELGLADAVIWAGLRGDVDDLLAAMDIWVMSSVREGLPVALLEAMACEKAIVATAIGGIPDAVSDGIEALLVPAADPVALARAIGILLDDPARAASLARAARERAVRDYSIDAVARTIEDIYRAELAHVMAKGRNP